MLGKRKNKKTTRMDTLVGPQSEVVGDIKFSGGLHVERSYMPPAGIIDV